MNYFQFIIKCLHKQEIKKMRAERDGQAFPNYATVVTGESFYRIMQSERLQECLIELILQSKTIIGARFSPS